MTKRHFIALADTLSDLHADIQRDATTPQMRAGRFAQWQNTLNALADFCASQNPRFNRERWLGYIAGLNGPNGGKRK